MSFQPGCPQDVGPLTINASQLAYRLSRHVEAVCRHYLSNGHIEGRYWRVGDTQNAKGRSLFVRLYDDSQGRLAGRWQDAATGQYGDLLDIIREACGFSDFKDAVDEARRFLVLPHLGQGASTLSLPRLASKGSTASARRLFGLGWPIATTLAETYLADRGLRALCEVDALRFHPRCYYGGEDAGPHETWPALIAAITDFHGHITGVHRTYLDPKGWHPVRLGKAPVDCPKRSMGNIHGYGVRLGTCHDVLAAGEGLETVGSLRGILPSLPTIAALSATHLASLLFPPGLIRLYIIRDNDAAGFAATTHLADRARKAGIDVIALSSRLDDLNSDLRTLGPDAFRTQTLTQILPADVMRFS